MTAKSEQRAEIALQDAAKSAAVAVALGWGDDLVVLQDACPVVPGEQGDDGVRAVAAIDVLRHLIERYEA